MASDLREHGSDPQQIPPEVAAAHADPVATERVAGGLRLAFEQETDQPSREVDPTRRRERQRSPDPAIDLHQLRSLPALPLHHDEAAEAQLCQQATRPVVELRIQRLALAERTRAARR